MSSALEHAAGTNNCKCMLFIYMVRLLDRRVMSDFGSSSATLLLIFCPNPVKNTD